MEDLISRQDVLDLAKKGILVSNGNYESVCKAINEIPPVNPTKTGHCIETDKYESYRFKCSECYRGTDDITDYCPNCGCRMIEPQERSDKK